MARLPSEIVGDTVRYRTANQFEARFWIVGRYKGVGQQDELLGFLAGVAADGMFNDQEIEALSQ